MVSKNIKPIYTKEEAFYRALSVNSENVEELTESLRMIVNYYKSATDDPLDYAIYKFLADCDFEALTEQTKEQIGLNEEGEYFV